MQFSLMLYQTKAQFTARDEANTQAFGRFVGAMQEAGVLLMLLGIDPPETARTVRSGNGAPQVEDGPYADTNAHLGGLCVIEVADLDAALAWAKRAPLDRVAAIEVRPTRVVPVG